MLPTTENAGRVLLSDDLVGWSVLRSSMTLDCLPKLALILADASWLLAEGGSCSSEVAVLGAFAPSSIGGAGGGLEEAAPCSNFLISISVQSAV